MQTQLYQKLVDKHRKEIMDAEEYIWHHPETGFREWKTDAYMQAVFEGALTAFFLHLFLVQVLKNSACR